MIYPISTVVNRSVLAGMLLVALGGCAIFHPYRLPTPKPSPEFKAQQKAAARARKNRDSGSLFKKKPAPDAEAATDVSTPTGGAAPPPTATASADVRTLAERPTVRYDKNGLMKKPKLMRRRKHKPASKPFRPWRAVRHFFKFNFHGKPNYSPDHRPVVPAPDAAPEPAPDAKP